MSNLIHGNTIPSIRKGTDTTLTITDFIEGTSFQRLDISQNGNIVITKTENDFRVVNDMAFVEITQEETLRIDTKRVVELQLSYLLGGKAKRTPVIRVSAEKVLYKEAI